MTQVCFAIPDDEFERDFLQLPLDVANACAALRAEGVGVSVWDNRLDDSPPGDIPDPDLVVVVTAIADRAQCYPLVLDPVRELVGKARGRWPGARVLACGPHATHLPEATRTELGADFVARGEVDSAAIQAVRDLTGGKPALPVLPLVDSYPQLPTEEWPLPAYDLFDLSAYTAEVFMDGRVRRGSCGMVLGVRGCTYGCTFCHLPFGTRMRPQPVERTLAEIAAMRERDVDFVFFLDYVFGLHPTFYKELCEALTGEGLGWTGQSRAEVVLRTDVEQWAKAGCKGMWLGAESPGIAETPVGKRVKPGVTDSAVRRLQDAGVTPFAFILIGLPDDPACASGELLEWATNLPGYFGLNQLFLRPGTALYDQLAPRYNDGRTPATWAEVEAVTRRYRESYPVDLDALRDQLMRLPNYLGNAMATL
ncbi:radical SAM protein [Streptomyces sp. V2]|uniref:B12-binding domain-containing radical SAM protein n=1 Tax=Streptomyces TaxID=1883 RepID=UPI000D66A8C4|nr:radical SAM protein [Streptomyces sp. V2]PWG13433.1 radical SAM protein [Streptomyces sp. V2]